MRPFTRERLAARYRYIETLSPDGLVWELQRRSLEYRAAFEAVAKVKHDPPPKATDATANRWRLRLPGKS